MMNSEKERLRYEQFDNKSVPQWRNNSNEQKSTHDEHGLNKMNNTEHLIKRQAYK